MTTISDFLASHDQEVLVIAELFPSAEVEANWTWTLTATKTHTFETTWVEGDVITVSEGGTKYARTFYVEKYNIADVEATASTFFFDGLTNKLYLHTSGGDSPATIVTGAYKYCIIADFCVGFTNRQQIGHDICFEREEQKLLDPNIDYWNPNVTAASRTPVHWTVFKAGTTAVVQDLATVYDADSYASVKITVDATPNAGGLSQTVALPPRRKARIQFKYKMTTGGDGAYFMIKDSGSNVYLNAGGEWQTASIGIGLLNSVTWASCTLTFITHASYSSYIISVVSATANSVVYFDYVELYILRRPMYYRPLLSDESIPEAYQGVGDFFQGDDKFQSGTLTLLQDGWLWQKRNLYLWHNKVLQIKAGGIDFAYADMQTFIYGTTKTPKFSDEKVEISFTDDRFSKLGPLTVDRLLITDWPNMDTNFENQTYPVILGPVVDIVPIRVDNKKYLVSQTVFQGTTYPVYQIYAVYKNKKLLTVTTDYTVDLNAGTFTLVKAAKNAKITCSVNGLQRNWETGAWGVNVTALIWFALVVCRAIDPDTINLASLKALWTFTNGDTTNVITAGDFFQGDMELSDFLNLLKRSAFFQIYTDVNGRWNFPSYDASGSSTGVPEFYDWDFQDEPEITELTESAFREVVIKWKSCQEWGRPFDEYAKENNATLWRYGINGTLTVETALSSTTSLSLLADGYFNLIAKPLEKLTVTLPAKAFTLRPLDKFKVLKTVKTQDDATVTVIDEAVYVVLEITKNLTTLTAKVTAFLDIP